VSNNDSVWHVGVAPWIIQDGNYGDFAIADETSFALEFYKQDEWRRSDIASRTASHQSGANHHVTAEVVLRADDWYVIDFGIRAYCEGALPTTVIVGDFVAGGLYLGIDPFFYFERLSKRDDAPPLSYEWRVEAIQRETTPLILDESKKAFVPNVAHVRRESVRATDAWSDSARRNVSVEYVLRCALVAGPRMPSQPGDWP
jgi:hypothetical protein